ncbi:MAG: FtsH-binding integral membrane protein [Pirellulaceae bacterium]
MKTILGQAIAPVVCSVFIAIVYAVAGNMALLVVALFFVVPLLLHRIWHSFPAPFPRITTVVFFVLATVSLAVRTNWRDPLALSSYLFTLGLFIAVYCLITLLINRLKRSPSIPAILAVVATVLFAFYVWFEFNIKMDTWGGGLVACPEYRQLIRIADDGSISGEQAIVLAIDLSEHQDVTPTASDSIANDRDQRLAARLTAEGYDKWKIEETQFAPNSENDGPDVTVLLTKPSLDFEVQKAGWVREVATIKTDRHLDTFGFGRAQDVRLTIEAPKGFSLSHNLNGTFSESVLDDGQLGQRLVANEILSRDRGKIRLSFIYPAFQIFPIGWLGGFSTWMVVACLGSSTFGTSFALNGHRRHPLKSVVVTIFRRLGLLPKAPSIFISYRRLDSQEVVGRLYDRLTSAFGDSNVFKDVESIPLGGDFREKISAAVASCDVLLVVIGEIWLTVTDDSGNERLQNPSDYVRVEIESALARNIPIIPLLVGEADAPREDKLPVSIQALAFRNATRVRPDPDFQPDIDRLILGVEELAKVSRAKLVGK